MAEAVQPGELITVLLLSAASRTVVVARAGSGGGFHVRTRNGTALLFADDEEGVHWIRDHHAADSTAIKAVHAARALAT